MAIGENGANLKALMDDMDLRNRSSFVNTYKLIDKQGIIHPLYWQHSDNMNSLIETIDKMNQ